MGLEIKYCKERGGRANIGYFIKIGGTGSSPPWFGDMGCNPPRWLNAGGPPAQGGPPIKRQETLELT